MTYEQLQQQYDNETEEDYEDSAPVKCEYCGSIVVGDTCKACKDI